HAAWQLGHLCSAETRMMKAVKPDAAGILPDGFAEKFTRDTAGGNDAAQFLPKAVLLETFAKARAASIEILNSLSEADFAREIPSPFKQGAMTTVGFMMNMPALHTTLHIGQFQVIRRALGKPILF